MAILSVAGRRIMTFVTLVLLLCSTSVFSAPAGSGGGSSWSSTFRCDKSKPYIRREWRDMSLIDRFQFLLAMNCILAKPGRTPKNLYAGVKSRYDDLVGTHINQTFQVHYVGHFLPFHRYYTWTMEKMLRDEAGYTGPFPYWDWHRDVGQGNAKFLASPIWDGVLGFGGNGDYLPVPPAQAGFAVPGRTGGGCVKNGAFKNMVVNLGPGNDFSGNGARCLSRDFSPYFAGRYLAQNQTKLTLQAKNFYDFDVVVEGGPSFEASGVHGGGHYSVGGTLGIMGDLYVSPGDPAFWLHHANLDRVWWSWQKLNYPARLTDFGGPSCLMDYYKPNPPAGQPNQACPNVTLDQPLDLQYASMVLPGVSVKVRDIMNIADMCYGYDKLFDINANQIYA